jgi:hypothetical protein
MRRLLISALLISTLLSTASTAVFAAPTIDNSPVLGVWKAQMNSLPLMTLTVEQENGQLIGAVLFYLLRRSPGAPETATAGVPEPLIDLAFDGKTLNFKVSHSLAHAGSEQTPPVTFHFELTPDGKLRALGPEGQPVELVRESPF